jgi:hypothetical protein
MHTNVRGVTPTASLQKAPSLHPGIHTLSIDVCMHRRPAYMLLHTRTPTHVYMCRSYTCVHVSAPRTQGAPTPYVYMCRSYTCVHVLAPRTQGAPTPYVYMCWSYTCVHVSAPQHKVHRRHMCTCVGATLSTRPHPVSACPYTCLRERDILSTRPHSVSTCPYTCLRERDILSTCPHSISACPYACIYMYIYPCTYTCPYTCVPTYSLHAQTPSLHARIHV